MLRPRPPLEGVLTTQSTSGLSVRYARWQRTASADARSSPDEHYRILKASWTGACWQQAGAVRAHQAASFSLPALPPTLPRRRLHPPQTAAEAAAAGRRRPPRVGAATRFKEMHMSVGIRRHRRHRQQGQVRTLLLPPPKSTIPLATAGPRPHRCWTTALRVALHCCPRGT